MDTWEQASYDRPNAGNAQRTNRDMLTQRRIFRFWMPLAAMWLMMAVEQPLIAAVVARMPHPEQNLAAYGLCFALALVVESPVIMLLTAGTALARDGASYRRLLRFTHLLGGGLTALHLLVAFTPLFDLILRGLIGAPTELVATSRTAFALLTPWTAAVAYRRLWQGVLIRFHHTGVVPVTIATRLVVSGAVLAAGYLSGRFAGVHVAMFALSAGVISAAVAAYLFCRPVLRSELGEGETSQQPLPWRELVGFYLPLALTSLILLLSRPVINVGLARSPQPLVSLAAWPVILGVLFLGRSVAMSYQEAVIALLEDRQSLAALKRFTLLLAGALLLAYALFVATPLIRAWFGVVAGLTPPFVEFSLLPTVIIAVLPAVSVLISWRRGLLVYLRRTPEITRSVLLNVSILIATLIGVRAVFPVSGAVLAAAALTASVLGEWLYLRFRSTATKGLLWDRLG